MTPLVARQVSGAQLTFTQPERSVPLKRGTNPASSPRERWKDTRSANPMRNNRRPSFLNFKKLFGILMENFFRKAQGIMFGEVTVCNFFPKYFRDQFASPSQSGVSFFHMPIVTSQHHAGF